MVKTYRVRDGFVVHLGGRDIHEGGALIDLDGSAAEMHAHKIEEYTAEQAAAEQAAAEQAAAEQAAAEQAAAEQAAAELNNTKEKS